jgi:signal transduction histidine kinase
MVGLSEVRIKVSQQLLRHRWLVVALVGLAFVGFEVIEHLNLGDIHSPFDANFVREVLIFGVALPLVSGVVLTLLIRTETERVHAVRYLDLQHELSHQLSRSRDWDELAATLVRFLSKVLPLVGASLLVYDHDRARFELVAIWQDPDGKTAVSPISLQTLDLCRACNEVQASSFHSLVPCYCRAVPDMPVQLNGYCLPLAQGNQPIALLHLYLPPNVSPSALQIEALNSIAPSIALVIDSNRPQRLAAVREAATRAERRRIARELHDTLGQNLGYVRLKLDQLTGDDALQEVAAIREELERMRDSANAAYHQMRETLAILHPLSSTDLATALLTQARLVGEQANFEVKLTNEGQSHPLSPLMQHEVLSLFQEALTNVAKHARAQHVGILLTWAADALTIRLLDDGQGFEPEAIQPNGNFGLTIMQERAEEINGTLTLTSRPDIGTQVTLQLPLS